MPTANRSTSVSATSLGATVSGYLEAVASHAQATMKRVRLWIPGPVSMRTQFLAGTFPLDRSCWLRLLPQELRCSLDPGLNHGPSIGPRLALASSCERIRDAIPFLPTESFRLSRGLRLTLGVDRDLLFKPCDPVTPLASLLETDDTSAARGRCGWKTGIGIQCESKVESSQPRPASGLPGH